MCQKCFGISILRKKHIQKYQEPKREYEEKDINDLIMAKKNKSNKKKKQRTDKEISKKPKNVANEVKGEEPTKTAKVIPNKIEKLMEIQSSENITPNSNKEVSNGKEIKINSKEKIIINADRKETLETKEFIEEKEKEIKELIKEKLKWLIGSRN